MSTTQDTSALFKPLTVKSLTIPNRIVMAPMTRSMAPGGIPGEANADYYRRRAEGGVGLVISEGTVVDRPEAGNHPDIPYFHGEDAIAGWRGVVNAVHEGGGLFAPQIWHTGAVGPLDPGKPRQQEPEGPSGLTAPGKPLGRTMAEEDIADTIAAFAKAAKSAVDIGCDTIELHAAHGYLIDQFFWAGTNERTDQWGGETIAQRNRFAVEIIKSVRETIGSTPLIVRVSQWKQQDYEAKLAANPEEMTEWLAPLVEAGADILHCSQRRFWEPEFPEIDGEQGLNFAGWAKKLTGVPTISVGSVSLENDFFNVFAGRGSSASGLDELVRRMEAEEFDLIAVGRALLTDPNWAKKVEAGEIEKLEGFDPASMGELV